MIMHMIGKLGEDKKADWPSHLAEIAHAYNATQSAVTRYSPHYLMFGHDGLGSQSTSSSPPLAAVRPPLREASAQGKWIPMHSICERLIEEHP